jgi:hypothetical protein
MGSGMYCRVNRTSNGTGGRPTNEPMAAALFMAQNGITSSATPPAASNPSFMDGRMLDTW